MEEKHEAQEIDEESSSHFLAFQVFLPLGTMGYEMLQEPVQQLQLSETHAAEFGKRITM